MGGGGGKSVTGSYLTDRKGGLRESADARREELSTEGGGGDARSPCRAARLRREAEWRLLSDRWASESPSPAEFWRDPVPHASESRMGGIAVTGAPEEVPGCSP